MGHSMLQQIPIDVDREGDMLEEIIQAVRKIKYKQAMIQKKAECDTKCVYYTSKPMTLECHFRIWEYDDDEDDKFIQMHIDMYRQNTKTGYEFIVHEEIVGCKSKQMNKSKYEMLIGEMCRSLVFYFHNKIRGEYHVL